MCISIVKKQNGFSTPDAPSNPCARGGLGSAKGTRAMKTGAHICAIMTDSGAGPGAAADLATRQPLEAGTSSSSSSSSGSMVASLCTLIPISKLGTWYPPANEWSGYDLGDVRFTDGCFVYWVTFFTHTHTRPIPPVSTVSLCTHSVAQLHRWGICLTQECWEWNCETIIDTAGRRTNLGTRWKSKLTVICSATVRSCACASTKFDKHNTETNFAW